MKRSLTAMILISAAASASAEVLLEWPVDCKLGDTCYIQNYVDTDPGPGWQDFMCGALSYDGHKGTDIALPLRNSIEDRVSVRAAAPGIVTGVRDGMADDVYRGGDLEGRDCGNGVVVTHADGWVTQYCHLRKGSVTVAQGASVAAGDPLGDIGLSGRTEFAHLHLSIRKDDEVVDPFRPDGAQTCGPSDQTLWAGDVQYKAGGLLDIGFSRSVPEYDDVKSGLAAQQIARDAPLVLFGFGFGAQIGDVMRLSITGPRGLVFETEAELDRNRAQFFRAGGKRAPAEGWPPGTYTGDITLVRQGTPIDTRTITAALR
ncbi:M23 family metallopeptidase [Primorskyibacter sp. S187A]|uniref:M23 family metallopeptidase n=1 Tax=Primorskyibacter sp. S187A TaxID=3415130 RepID=UPI003C7C36E6